MHFWASIEAAWTRVVGGGARSPEHLAAVLAALLAWLDMQTLDDERAWVSAFRERCAAL